jgi:hypothetical protein
VWLKLVSTMAGSSSRMRKQPKLTGEPGGYMLIRKMSGAISVTVGSIV